MNTGSTSSLVLRNELSRVDGSNALRGCRAGYSNNTSLAYHRDLRWFVFWGISQDLELFGVKRTHTEMFVRRLEHRCGACATTERWLWVVTGFYRNCTEDNLVTATLQRTYGFRDPICDAGSSHCPRASNFSSARRSHSLQLCICSSAVSTSRSRVDEHEGGNVENRMLVRNNLRRWRQCPALV